MPSHFPRLPLGLYLRYPATVNEYDSRITAIILAAGQARRFGSPKQLLDWHGQPLLRHVILQALAAPVAEIVVVLGAHAARVAPAAHGLPVALAVNHAWSQGMSSSVKVGLRATRVEPDAAIFLLADQPLVTPDLIQRIIEAHRTTRAGIVAPRAGDRPGNPVLFARAFFPSLMQLTGDQGGRVVMRAHPSAIHWLDADEWAVFDIDEPGDLTRREV